MLATMHEMVKTGREVVEDKEARERRRILEECTIVIGTVGAFLRDDAVKIHGLLFLVDDILFDECSLQSFMATRQLFQCMEEHLSRNVLPHFVADAIPRGQRPRGIRAGLVWKSQVR